MASSNEEVKFDFDNIHPVDLRLLDGQVDLILRALELYVYNLDTCLIAKNHLMKKDRKKLQWLNLHLNKYYLQKQNKLIQNQMMVQMKFQ